ncbi:anion exchange protein 3 isoform X1 [Gadus morhua]|uniref:anion exchange protein 3 isoform X1 n=3 Tax=Gadus morhua TaxID=8049 RepID=UPI0011B6C316|nr:anion exchange protein 3-like isoform X1 [Gadus morhua]XP_030198774.1 anion exchange protein 3-like isoform X1 [Gadus morhua]
MATGGHAPEIDVLANLQPVEEEEDDDPSADREKEGEEEEEDEEEEREEDSWEKVLSVERFGDIISNSGSSYGERMGRHYSERDFENHRHTFHHTHHPLSTHLPLPQRLRKRPHGGERRRKKRRRKKKTSMAPSEVTPTIHEVDEEEAELEGEEAESEADGRSLSEATPTHLPADQPQFSSGNQEQPGRLPPVSSFHVETETVAAASQGPMGPAGQKGRPAQGGRQAVGRTASGPLAMEEEEEEEEEEGDTSRSTLPSPDHVSLPTSRGWFRRRSPHRRPPGAQRSSYDLRERVYIGSLMPLEMAVYQQVPTDEAEAQMLASSDLDDMKSHRFEDNPGVRRHLVKKSSRCQLSRANSSGPLSSLKKKKRAADKKTHEVFVELNELIVEKDHEMRWKERARWIKFEEDVEEETERWGKPHVASLSFRSLLELRRTITHGAILLDLEQNTLPGIAHLVVETMVMSDQIRAEDRSGVLRALLLKHSHPSDMKHRFHRLQSTSSLQGSFNHQPNHLHPTPPPDTNLPPLAEDGEEHPDKGPVYDPKQEVFVSLFKSLHPLPPEGHPAAARSMKLLAKIPKDAEAVIVLCGCVEFLEQPAMAFVRLNEAVLLESVLEVPVPVRFLFVLLGPSQNNMDYHEIGRSFSTLMSDQNFHEVAYFADDRQDLLNGINEFLDCSIVLPPSDVAGKDLLKTVAGFQKEMMRKRKERVLKKQQSFCLGPEQVHKEATQEDQEEADQEVDPLKRSGVPFGGLIHDVRRRYPRYVSDLRDALDIQCVAAVIFIYFAALSPTITFGGLLGEKTEGMMGVSELIVSTATLGVVFSLLGGQPLLIIGFSGPLLVFEEAFYKFCQAHDFEYLTGRVWIGFWLVFIVLVMVAAEGSFLVRYISPFTQEIFAFLISLIFIYETFSKLIKVFQEHPLMETYPASHSHTGPWIGIKVGHPSEGHEDEAMVLNQPNTALLSLVLMMGTFFVAFFLRKFRNSRFLGGKARRIIGDFGIPISILLSVLLDYSISDTYTQKLNVPSGFSVTSPDKRGWFISPFGDKKPFPPWMMAASIVPALLVFILIFMETQITSLIVSKKERRLVKGSGFHLDLLLIVTLGAFCPLLGLPWLTAATVRSVTHVNALTVMSKATAPGAKPVIQEVKEQRVTGLVVAVLVGMSIVMTDVLRLIPLAVLFGIFLYMGVTSLTGIQLYERITLMVTPAKHHPDHLYVTKVKTWRMNMFTLIQLACIVSLWVVKSTEASLAFPFILIMTVPLRRLVLSRIFQERELQALDCDEDTPNFDEDGRDEYNEIHMLV